MNKYFIENFFNNYSDDINQFYNIFNSEKIGNIEINIDKLYIFIFFEEWDQILQRYQFQDLLTNNKINSTEIPDTISYMNNVTSGNLRGIYIQKLEAIMIKLKSQYSSYEEVYKLLIAEYNHYLLRDKANLFSADDLPYWDFFIDEGITNFFSDYLEYEVELNEENITHYINGYHQDIVDGIVVINKQDIKKYGQGQQVELKGYDVAVDFNIWIIESFGLNKYINFLGFLYSSNYISMDNCFIKTFDLSFQEMLTEWYKN